MYKMEAPSDSASAPSQHQTFSDLDNAVVLAIARLKSSAALDLGLLSDCTRECDTQDIRRICQTLEFVTTLVRAKKQLNDIWRKETS